MAIYGVGWFREAASRAVLRAGLRWRCGARGRRSSRPNPVPADRTVHRAAGRSGARSLPSALCQLPSAGPERAERGAAARRPRLHRAVASAPGAATGHLHTTDHAAAAWSPGEPRRADLRQLGRVLASRQRRRARRGDTDRQQHVRHRRCRKRGDAGCGSSILSSSCSARLPRGSHRRDGPHGRRLRRGLLPRDRRDAAQPLAR